MSESDQVDVVVESPRGSRNKYEFDEERGVMRLDRRILGAVAFPADYGFVPGTVGEDGEPLDALALLDEPTYPGIWVAARVVGCRGSARAPDARPSCCAYLWVTRPTK